MDTTDCPECGAVAEVEERFVLESTDGPVEHARIGCARRHWFLLPVSRLALGRLETCSEEGRTAVGRIDTIEVMAAESPQTALPPTTPDGRFWWDGTQWVAFPDPRPAPRVRA